MAAAANGPRFPPLPALTEGGTRVFIHSETADPEASETLSLVLGPFGFQVDALDGVPGTESYSPLCRLNLVTWNDSSQARMLRSADEVRSALHNDEITVERPGVVIRAPVLM